MVLDFVRCFFCILHDCGFLTFIRLLFRFLNQPFIPEINPTWAQCIIFFIYCWIEFACISLRIFVSMFVRDTGLWFLSWNIFVRFWCLWSQNELEIMLFSYVFEIRDPLGGVKIIHGGNRKLAIETTFCCTMYHFCCLKDSFF